MAKLFGYMQNLAQRGVHLLTALCALLWLLPTQVHAQGNWIFAPAPITTTAIFNAFTPIDVVKEKDSVRAQGNGNCDSDGYCYDHINPDLFPVDKLYFKPTLKVQNATLEKLAGQYGAQNPDAKSEIRKVFFGEGSGAENKNLIQKIKPFLWKQYFRVDNVGHAFTVFAIAQYEAATGTSVGQDWHKYANAVKYQSEQYMLKQPVAANSDAEKQAFAESLLVFAAMTQGSAAYVKTHPEAQGQFQQNAKAMAKVYGLDFDKIVLTEFGFVAR